MKLLDCTIMWSSQRGRTYTTKPASGQFFSQLGVLS
jgi:hypothetical protein